MGVHYESVGGIGFVVSATDKQDEIEMLKEDLSNN